MKIEMVILWLILCLVFAIVESATGAMVSIWFVVGSAVAFIAALLGAPIGLQFGLFVAVSIITAATVLIVEHKTKFMQKHKQMRENPDSIVGKTCMVISVDINRNCKVRVNDVIWNGYVKDGTIVKIGGIADIEKIEGNRLIVKGDNIDNVVNEQ